MHLHVWFHSRKLQQSHNSLDPLDTSYDIHKKKVTFLAHNRKQTSKHGLRNLQIDPFRKHHFLKRL